MNARERALEVVEKYWGHVEYNDALVTDIAEAIQGAVAEVKAERDWREARNVLLRDALDRAHQRIHDLEQLIAIHAGELRHIVGTFLGVPITDEDRRRISEDGP